MAQDNGRDFWKDEAKLAAFDSDRRMKFWVGLAGGLIFLVAQGAFGHLVGLEGILQKALAISVSVLLFPTLVAMEMFSKGRDAGNRLMSELDDLKLQSEKDENVESPLIIHTHHTKAKGSIQQLVVENCTGKTVRGKIVLEHAEPNTRANLPFVFQVDGRQGQEVTEFPPNGSLRVNVIQFESRSPELYGYDSKTMPLPQDHYQFTICAQPETGSGHRVRYTMRRIQQNKIDCNVEKI